MSNVQKPVLAGGAWLKLFGVLLTVIVLLGSALGSHVWDVASSATTDDCVDSKILDHRLADDAHPVLNQQLEQLSEQMHTGFKHLGEKIDGLR